MYNVHTLLGSDNMSATVEPGRDSEKKAGGLVWFDEPPPPRATERLSRERIVAAAIALADDDVRGEVTMRAIAARLGSRTPMSLYRYVGSKNGLADLMVDEVYAEISVPGDGDWRTKLQGLGRSAWQATQRHPWFARLAFSRPPFGPHALAMYDAALAALDDLGLDAARRMSFVSTVLGQVLSSGLAVLEERSMRERVGLRTDAELAEVARPYLERIAADGRYPHFSRWAQDPARFDAVPDPFEQILEWLLDGLAGQLPE
jgi:AcrR family transcriptional regulator